MASDLELARVAGELRVLRLDQLRAAGLSENAIRHRIAQGRLQRLWPGVFLVGPAEASPLSLAYAATESFSGATYVTDLWACFVHRFAPVPDLPVDVLVVSGTRHRRPNVRAHRCGTIGPGDLGHVGRVPVVSPGRAILAAAERASLTRVEALISDAHAAGVLTESQLDDVLERAGRHPGVGRVRAVMQETRGFTRSEAERILRRLLRDARLPQPIANHRIGRYEADLAWPAYRLIVEFDSWSRHGQRPAFGPDRRRGSELTAQGWSVMHVTWDDLKKDPLGVVARVAGALAVRA